MIYLGRREISVGINKSSVPERIRQRSLQDNFFISSLINSPASTAIPINFKYVRATFQVGAFFYWRVPSLLAAEREGCNKALVFSLSLANFFRGIFALFFSTCWQRFIFIAFYLISSGELEIRCRGFAQGALFLWHACVLTRWRIVIEVSCEVMQRCTAVFFFELLK